MSEILKVASSSNPSATAGALANTIREEGKARLQAIGPKAVNQMIKAITIARGYMAPSGVDLIFMPSFVDVQINEGKKTALRLHVKTRLPYRPDQKKEEEEKVESSGGEPPEKENPNREEKPKKEETDKSENEEEKSEEDILDF